MLYRVYSTTLKLGSSYSERIVNRKPIGHINVFLTISIYGRSSIKQYRSFRTRLRDDRETREGIYTKI